MAGVVRRGQDIAGGVLIQGSSNVFVENKEAVHIGDIVAPHGRFPHSSPIMISGSKTVFVNNIPICREGDIASCGHVVTGSSTVFAG